MEFVRRADRSDTELLVALYRSCVTGASGTRGADMYAARESFREPLSDAIDAVIDEGGLALVSGIDEVVLGFALVHLENLRNESTHAVVDALYVDPEARAVGLGEAMMDEILQWVKESGAVTVDATALPGDRETKNFFEMSGFTARLIVMHHKMDK